MKILWVKAGGLLPPDSGRKLRSYHILKELARTHEVFLFLSYRGHAGDRHGELEKEFARVELWPHAAPAPGSLAEYFGYARAMVSGRPHSVLRDGPAEASRRLEIFLAAVRPDILVCDLVAAGEMVPWDAPCPIVLFAHHVERVIWKRHVELAHNPLWKAVCWSEFRSIRRIEQRFLERADHVLTVSEADRAVFARHLDPAKLTVIPTGVDIYYYRPGPDTVRSNWIVFTGSMDWKPNEDGILYFAAEILPRVRAQLPSTTLWVVGRNPSRRLLELATRESGIRVPGTVEDIRPYVRPGAVYVVPLRAGSGTRLKIFEAMAMGKAIVSTSAGAEGLPVVPGEHLLLADDPGEFAQHVGELLQNPTRRAELGWNARKLVEENFSWSSVAAAFETALARVIEGFPRAKRRLEG